MTKPHRGSSPDTKEVDMNPTNTFDPNTGRFTQKEAATPNTFGPTALEQVLKFVKALSEVVDPANNSGVLQGPEYRTTEVPGVFYDMCISLQQLPQLLPGKAILKADSPRYGAFTIERNGRAPWILWVRAHDDSGDSRTFGLQGFALQVGYRPEDTYVSKHIDAAIAVMKKVLMAPDVQLRGGVFPAVMTL